MFMLSIFTVNGITATSEVTVKDIAPTGLKLNKTATIINTGKTEILLATVSPTNATNKTITWDSSNKTVATVDKNGTVKGIKAGVATITAKTVNGKMATCKITVEDIIPTGVKLDKTSASIEKDSSVKITATVNPANATNKKVTWTSSNTKIAKVDKNGKVTGVSAGTVTITCKTVDGGKTVTCKVNVDGWISANNKYSYLKEGKKLIGFYYFTSKEGEKTPHWSYFDKNGVMLTGWQWLGKGTSNPDGDKAKHMSYFGDNGWMRTGWQEMGKGTQNSYDENTNKHYSFFGENGWMRTGKQTINKKTYTFNGNGWLTNPTKP